MRFNFVLAILGLFIFLTSLTILVWPNTYLSQMNISFWPKPVLYYLLNKKGAEPITIIIDGKETQVRYLDLGMTLDTKKTMESLTLGYNLTEILKKWIYSPSVTTIIQPSFSFDDDFETKVAKILPKKSLLNENIKYDKNLGQFNYLVDERKTRVDTVDLQVKLISFTDLEKKTITGETITESNELEKRVDKVNKDLALLKRSPLEIKINDSNETILIESEQIPNLINVETKDFLKSFDLTVNKDSVSRILADNGMSTVSIDWATRTIKNNLVNRFGGGQAKPVVLGSDTGPNTDGTIASKYIEVDLSQQKMYFFENGELFKPYSVSTGLNYPTPVGNYKIKNKLPIGFSAIFNVWMPWWMAFEYAEDIGAYLGIHELPYKLVGGKKIYRFGNYIGNRKTGGCVALSPGDSKEVYDKSFPGMDVVIFK